MKQEVSNLADDSNKEKLAHRRFQLLTLGVALLSLTILTWYIFADQITPFTDNSRVRAFVSPVSTSVSGYVINLPVKNNQIVEKGDLIAKIDPEPYKIAVEQARAELELAGKDVGIKTAHVATANANYVEAQMQLRLAKLNYQRVYSVGQKGYVSKSEVDDVRTSLEVQKAHLKVSLAELEQAKLDAGSNFENNPTLTKALAKLSQAEFDLKNTTIFAPRKGVISNLRYDVGVYINAGSPIMTHISTNEVWIEAYLRENNLQNIEHGDNVSIVFDSAPGKIFRGEVSSISYGVQFDSNSTIGQLQSAIPKTGWLRDAQRFPVIIKLTSDIPTGVKREGGQADIVVFTKEHGLMALLGRIYIKVMSWLSYVY
ncbi:HlyD family secretion protein [Vibrio rotiferianus]|uniref:HlyD family secretion protein n=1 Tax=Vibrio rotiferianus TaxID=190895 RepID=UPI000B59E275|nr:HlyD family secretion protein [Vibrio rotiferianus]ASI96581.1 hypothetical protein BSZ04_16660 [Vibrio rotiferianus]